MSVHIRKIRSIIVTLKYLLPRWLVWHLLPDGSAGVSGKSGFKAESGRYHLYVSLACPWAHRTLIFRELKGLQDHITVDVVHPDMMNEGWTFEQRGAAKGDSLFQSKFAHEIYTRANPTANTRVTVPILWDKKTSTIVSNEYIV